LNWGAKGQLSFAYKINRLAQDSQCLLRRVEAGRIFRLDKVDVELRFALEVLERK
jgi:hypothetical protein